MHPPVLYKTHIQKKEKFDDSRIITLTQVRCRYYGCCLCKIVENPSSDCSILRSLFIFFFPTLGFLKVNYTCPFITRFSIILGYGVQIIAIYYLIHNSIFSFFLILRIFLMREIVRLGLLG